MSQETYDKAAGIRRSDLWLINKTPLHFHAHMTTEKEQTRAMAFGSAVHAYILERETFRSKYLIAPNVDRRTKAGKAELEEFLEECAETGAESVTVEDMQTIVAMAEALVNPPYNEFALSLLFGAGAKHEQEFYWTDPMTGEDCKCKVDCIVEIDGVPYIVDYKTTDSCEDGHFERTARKYGYQFQAGMYCEGVFQNTLTEHRFAFVAQEKNPPYACRVYVCDPEWVKRGYDKFRELIGLYHECKTNDNWPGYGDYELTED